MYFLIVCLDGYAPDVYGPLDKEGLKSKLEEFKNCVQKDSYIIRQVNYDYLSPSNNYQMQEGEFIVINGRCVDIKVEVAIQD